jgi:xylose isomerase
VEDLAQAHIVGMDSFARGLMVAQAILDDGELPGFVANRYKGYSSDIGKKIADKGTSLAELETWALDRQIDRTDSGRQEYLESLVNRFL